MTPSNKLIGILATILKWNKRRIECFVKMLLAIMIVRTVNLAVVANQIVGKAKPEHRYRRLQRFFADCKIDYDCIAKLVFKLFGFDKRSVYLSMDRTNWKWGKKDINILFLSVVYKGIGIPIYWLVLNKKGNSTTRERAALVQRFVKVFGRGVITGLLADREFIGGKWFSWLISEKNLFIIRVHNDANTHNKHNKTIDVSWLFHHLKPGEKKSLIAKKRVFGCEIFLSGGRVPNGELMVVASNIETEDAIKTYLLRWEIEVMFQCLKSRGFRFEDTHVTDRKKIKKLIVLLAIGFCWAHITGEWRHHHERKIKLKNHGRKEISYFRYGLNLIHDALAQLVKTIRPINRLIKLLDLSMRNFNPGFV
jgi:hypothetical protein